MALRQKMHFYLIQIKTLSCAVLVLSYFSKDEMLVSILFWHYLITHARLYSRLLVRNTRGVRGGNGVDFVLPGPLIAGLTETDKV